MLYFVIPSQFRAGDDAKEEIMVSKAAEKSTRTSAVTLALSIEHMISLQTAGGTDFAE